MFLLPLLTEMKEFKDILARHVYSAILVTLILGGLQPFGLNEAMKGRAYIVLLYGIGTYLSCVLADLIATFLLKMKYDENAPLPEMNRRRVAVNLSIIPFIGTVIYLSGESSGVLAWLRCCAYGIAISLVLFLVWIYKARSIVLRRQLDEAIRLNAILGERQRVSSGRKDDDSSRVFTLQGRGKESLLVSEDSLLYIESDENYIHVHVDHGGKEEVSMIRCTMKQADDTFQDSRCVVRCHKSFMVNTKFVCKVEGNSKGLILSLKNAKDEIPVSKTYLGDVRSRIVGLS